MSIIKSRWICWLQSFNWIDFPLSSPRSKEFNGIIYQLYIRFIFYSLGWYCCLLCLKWKYSFDSRLCSSLFLLLDYTYQVYCGGVAPFTDCNHAVTASFASWFPRCILIKVCKVHCQLTNIYRSSWFAKYQAKMLVRCLPWRFWRRFVVQMSSIYISMFWSAHNHVAVNSFLDYYRVINLKQFDTCLNVSLINNLS